MNTLTLVILILLVIVVLTVRHFVLGGISSVTRKLLKSKKEKQKKSKSLSKN